jgi:O-acetyl-ADP-ribose deacetylase (regulator of RNase III)
LPTADERRWRVARVQRAPAVRIEAIEAEITRLALDAIVNAANQSLLGGGGVDGAIHAAAGPRLLEACRRLRHTTHRDGLRVGDAVATPGFDLPARWVIHTVGPNRHRGQTDPALLASCFTRSLDVAAELAARTVAFPAVSAGVYGWAADDVARIAVGAVRDWPGAGVEHVRFVLFGERVLAAFERSLTP